MCPARHAERIDLAFPQQITLKLRHDPVLHEQAITARERADVLYGRETPETAARQAAALKEAYAREGPEGYWKKTLALASHDAQAGKLDSYELAAIYARLGERDKAFDLLTQACQDRNNEVLHLNEDMVWDEYRSDPRFQELVRRVGLKL